MPWVETASLRLPCLVDQRYCIKGKHQEGGDEAAMSRNAMSLGGIAQTTLPRQG